MFNQNQLQAVENSSPTFEPKSETPPTTPPPTTTAPEKTDIYYMPDTFRKNNSVAGKQTSIPGVWVLIVSFILLIFLGGGLILYWLRPSFLNGILGGKAPTAVPIPEGLIDNNSTVPALTEDEEATTKQGSPKETYLTFQRELSAVTTADGYLEIYLKYGTKDVYDTMLAEKNRLVAAGQTNILLERLRALGSPVLDGTEDIAETTSETEATLTITRTNNRDNGTVTLALEEGAWRIKKENWQTSTPVETTGELQPGVDTDKDGLTDKEEETLGTNIDKVDSDGDTYSDLAEVNNSYNPAGNGKLSEDKKLGLYSNKTFDISFLYPVDWHQTASASDDSIIFLAPDQQFIQMLVQPNTDREDILSWYKKTFNVETIPTSQLMTNQSWEGVRTPDGLTTYFTNKDKSYIFLITYSLDTNRVLNYKNILDLILRSLKFTV